MNTFILLFQCDDQKGIIARISDFIFKAGGNIITADQHSTDPEGGHFFFRVEFCIDQDKRTLEKNFETVGNEFSAEWSLHDKNQQLSMGVLVSRPDHCLVDLLYLVRSGELAVTIPFVVSNCGEHRDLVEREEIPFYFIDTAASDKKERELLSYAQNADFLVLARYMQILSSHFISQFGKDILNIHHSFLPSFKGADPYGQAFDRGVKVIGATAHYVTETLDEGPIISQIVESVSHRDTIEDLKRKGKNLEKRALSHAIHKYIEYRVIRYKNKTIVF